MQKFEVNFEDNWDEALLVESYDHEDAAAEAAEKAFYEHDGWEWLQDGEICWVRPKDDPEDVRKVEILIEQRPVFSGSEIYE